jgi:cytochrome c oxidase cbb3-type subunit 2
VPESNMPAYAWLADAPADATDIQAKMRALNIVGTGYTEDEINNAPQELAGKTEMEALIAYLQVLGTHGPKAQ